MDVGLFPIFIGTFLCCLQWSAVGDIYCSWPSVLWRCKGGDSRDWTSRDMLSGELKVVRATRASLSIRMPRVEEDLPREGPTDAGERTRRGGELRVGLEEQEGGESRDERAESGGGGRPSVEGEPEVGGDLAEAEGKHDDINELVDTQTHVVRCLATERNHKYRVYMKGDTYEAFSCMKFVSSGTNIINIHTAEPRSENRGFLCNGGSFIKQVEPWIAEVRHRTSECAVTGGYDVMTMTDKEDKVTCEDNWLPPRIEFDCIRGEGVVFYFPDKSCNFFNSSHSETRLKCWGHWVIGEVMNIYLASATTGPSYVMKLPVNSSEMDEFSAQVYRRPTLDEASPSHPGTNIADGDHGEGGDGGSTKDLQPRHLATMKVLRSEPGSCYDASKACVTVARKGDCHSYPYKSQCKRSCGFCAPRSRLMAECSFPEVLRGNKMFFPREGVRGVEMTITRQTVSMATVGRFTCKAHHHDRYRFKVTSEYENGCRPRFSCFNFQLSKDNLLMFKLSTSSLEDLPFKDLCSDFRSLGVHHTSSQRSQVILLPKETMYKGSCPLALSARTVVKFADHGNCSAIMTDRWPGLCGHKSSSLRLTSDKCLGQSLSHSYKCINTIRLGKTKDMLITKISTRKNYICWLVIRHQSGQRVISLTRVSCESGKELQGNGARIQRIIVDKEMNCVKRTTGSSLVDTTTTPTTASMGVSTTTTSESALTTPPPTSDHAYQNKLHNSISKKAKTDRQSDYQIKDKYKDYQNHDDSYSAGSRKQRAKDESSKVKLVKEKRSSSASGSQSYHVTKLHQLTLTSSCLTTLAIVTIQSRHAVELLLHT